MAVTFQQRAAELRSGDSYDCFSTCPCFVRSTKRGRVHWMLLAAQWTLRIGDSEDTDLGQVLSAEGWADSDEGAWRAAVEAAGTAEIYIGPASLLQRVSSIRAQQLRQQRWVAKQPAGAEAAATRYVFEHKPCEYYRGQDPYPYRRHRVLKETRQFLFVDASGFGEPINAAGEPNPNPRAFATRGGGTSYRISKAAFAADDEYDRAGAAWMGNYHHVWLSLEQLVEVVQSRSLQRHNAFGWRDVLGLPADEHLEMAAVKRAYRRSLMRSHPDHGGSREQLEAVQAAYSEAKRLVEAG